MTKRLTSGYASHGFCINVEEARSIGLKANELVGEELAIVWEVHRLNNKKRQLQREARGEEVMEMIKDLPPDLLDKLPTSLQEKLNTSDSAEGEE